MKAEADYIIKKDNPSEYRIVKFLDGEYSQEYGVARLDGKMECSCMSGIYRGYCKHKNWVHILEQGGKLPSNVVVEQVVSQEDMNILLEDLGGDSSGL